MAKSAAIGSKSDFSIQLFLFGDGVVGKTCLFIRAIENKFSFDTSATIGVDAHKKQWIIDEKKIDLLLWDSTGNSHFRSFVLGWSRSADGCLLVFDLTDASSLDSIVNWIQELHKTGRQDLPMILIGNKSDLTTQRKVTYNQAIAVANQFNISYIETSALDGSNIDTMFISLIRDVCHKKLPSSDQIKTMCNTCGLKQLVPMASCSGCSHYFCEKHIQEHPREKERI
ncbi:unnamed protein product [Rotaria magnacalcarata]|uniref:Uncharacterized protein n=1 Tax=Rotaria magnacalcarata TaxID=392030 RepID=A0A819LHS4_9BILA|nr:unnamed protein product [Rotaria magnacalcarata]CAF2087310.1 unnamed protein product [Rotaria magnacalcarata]CAF3964815.1 unnamed protein product [Rotaria magnacalcarata]CAF4114553.1 unnamed protein product [Rotaria magnacalcarata]